MAHPNPARRAARSVRPTQRAVRTVLAALALACVATPALAADGANLVLDVDRLRSSVRIATGVYHKPGRAPALDSTVPVSGTCVLHPDENCVGGPGIRKLLRFDVVVHNRGDEDLIVGNPKSRPDLFVYSACHRHYHFRKAARYELLDSTGQVIKTGRKQGFCIEDTIPSGDPATASPKRYGCTFQGIQVGWADWYPAILDCQWIDVTDLPPGSYMLHVFWNPDRLMPETTIADNEGTVPVTIPAATDAAPVVDRVAAPATPVTATSGRALDVAWSAHDDVGVVTQEIWLSTDDGGTWQQIVGDLPGDRTRHRFLVPMGSATATARIKVVARDASVQRGEKISEPFRIAAARPVRLPKLATP